MQTSLTCLRDRGGRLSSFSCSWRSSSSIFLRSSSGIISSHSFTTTPICYTTIQTQRYRLSLNKLFVVFWCILLLWSTGPFCCLKLKGGQQPRSRRKFLGNQPNSTRNQTRRQWSFYTYTTYRKQWPESTNVTAFLQPWDHHSRYQVCWHIPRTSPNYKMSVNVSTK